MDKDKLAQYLVLQKEINDIQDKIKNSKDIIVTDMVQASNPDFPYQEIHREIKGIAADNKAKRRLYRILKDRLEKARSAKYEIEEFINSIDDSYVRYIFEKRYIDGWSWVKISHELGSLHESYARKIHDRWIKHTWQV